MKTIDKLLHLLIPRVSNNHKAKLVHNSSLFVFSFLLIGFQIILNSSQIKFPKVLGYASQISPSEVIRLTNEKRAQAGLPALSENGTLSQAALAKGADMLNKGYWAHFAPDGTSPWKFFLDFGYRYKYAGENLARDFSNPSSAVEAWMASPTHRDNILNSKYKEVGIGVIEGSLAGADTTIIVQFFGAKSGGVATIPEAKAAATASPTEVSLATTKPNLIAHAVGTPHPHETVIASPTPTPTFNEVVTPSKVSPFSLTKNLSTGIVGVILLVLSIDLIVIKRNKIARIGGRTLAHIAYLGMILAIILILKAGEII